MPQSADLTQAEISWLEDGSPYSEHYQDIYFSTLDGMAETEYVFLKHNQFPQRFSEKQSLIIGETGFGTGLNFLVTVNHWLRYANNSTHKSTLQFVSTEKYPLTRGQLQRVYASFKQRWPCLTDVCDELLSVYPDKIYPAFNETQMLDLKFSDQLQLVILLGDVTEQLENLSKDFQPEVDAWYLDGFTPAKNKSMWTPRLFSQIARLSHPDATFSTFTAAGIVRRSLTKAGFKITKTRGFAHKREMLYGKV